MYEPPKYFKGLSTRKTQKRKKEIKKYGSMDFKDPKAYTGFNTDKGVKTRESKYTRSFKKMFGDAKSLEEKSKVTGVPLSALKESYNRGMAAWRTGHRPGATQQQWGYARVNSLLTCGKTFYTTDSDIVRKTRRINKKAFGWCK